MCFISHASPQKEAKFDQLVIVVISMGAWQSIFMPGLAQMGLVCRHTSGVAKKPLHTFNWHHASIDAWATAWTSGDGFESSGELFFLLFPSLYVSCVTRFWLQLLIEGSGWSTVVEYMPHGQEWMGLNLARLWELLSLLFYLDLYLSTLSINRSLKLLYSVNWSIANHKVTTYLM